MISDNWKLFMLSDLLIVRGGKRVPKGTPEFKGKSKHPYIRAQDLKNNRTLELHDGIIFISNDTFEMIRNYTVKTNDVIMSNVGSVGMVSIIGESLNGANLTENCVKFVSLKGIDSKYLYYYLSSPGGQQQIREFTVGAVQPKLPIRGINNFKFLLPPIESQESITSILSSLDDKIEVNNKINSNLEELAQTLYKRWFVDFQFPNEEGKPYKSSGGKMVESVLGMIPKGWEISQLSEFIFEAGKRTKPSSETISNPYVPIDCITSKSLTLWEYKDGEEAKSSLISFKAGDILFGAMRPYFHKVCIAPFNGTTRSTCLVLNSKHEDYFYFSTLTLFLESTIQFATQNSTGSTIPYISWKNGLGSLIVAVPESNVAARFNSILNPVFEKLLLSAHENRSLIEARDLLLPKLMSGEIEV